MKNKTFSFFLSACVLFAGCSSSHITTEWKANHLSFVNYHNILVAGVIKDEDVALRKKIENDFVNKLENLGYNSVSALNEFGSKGLSNLGEAETYLKLCNKGIDAVITITLIDKQKAGNKIVYAASDYPSRYYYDRIWNYKNIQAEVADKYSDNATYFWEIILFDLLTLQPQCTFQTKTFNPVSKNMNEDLLRPVIQKMIKEKILRKQKKDPSGLKKPF